MRRNDFLQCGLRRLNQMADIAQADSVLNHHQRLLVIDRDAPGEPQLHQAPGNNRIAAQLFQHEEQFHFVLPGDI